MRRLRANRLVALATACILTITSGCGYFLHPERVGQTEGRVDPAVVVLDAAGLLFGIIPGVVAFAVDISTGAIYLPSGEPSVIERHEDRLSAFGDLPLQATEADELPHAQSELARKLASSLGHSVDPRSIRYYKADGIPRKIGVKPL